MDHTRRLRVPVHQLRHGCMDYNCDFGAGGTIPMGYFEGVSTYVIMMKGTNSLLVGDFLGG